MTRLVLASLVAGATAGVLVTAQTPTTFKLGTFQRQDTTFVGVVLRDATVIDLAAANAAITTGRKVTAPSDMKDLIARYDSGVRDRIIEIVKAVGASRPAYIYDRSALRTRPPIMYPMTMLNVAVNYREHAVEMAGRQGGGSAAPAAQGAPPAPGTAPPGTTSAPGIWTRRNGDTRWNPYTFLKAPAAIVADGEAIRIPTGRTQIDWECELGVVVGRQAHHVPVEQAASYIFGYTLEQDISDRGGRGDNRYGSDWLIGKSHDTFAPMGPFITPKEFVPTPQNLPVKFMLNGHLMQDANTSLMIHDVFELIAYGSSIMTLRPGDVMATGSPAGVGSARTPPVYLKPGDKTVCTYEGVGTLSNPVEAAR
jgi:2-keto-4-pentenoate hydratase/2-oxohepta-3-ene-1,7-dioic acid hydratase in catechol pathway